jgi:methylmalonyl-CoA carboxyltransferase large subunit
MPDSNATLELIADRLATLLDRLQGLEARLETIAATLESKRPAEEEVSEEIALVIAAAVAAYLGKRPRIRRIRMVGSGAWAQQGRVSIQASHGIVLQHGG